MLIDVFFEFREIYGCRRLARELNKRNHACSVGLVAKIMRAQGLEAVQPRAFRVTTIHGEVMFIPLISLSVTSRPVNQAHDSLAISRI